jgi:hypothetical protein
VRPIMAAREEMARPPVLIRMGKPARVEPLFIYRLFVDARLNVHAPVAVNGRCLVVVVMMLDDFPMYDGSLDVMMLDYFTMHPRRSDVSFLFRIEVQIRSQGRTGEAHDGGRQESEALH